MVDFPIKTSIYKGFSIAMLNNQMVCFQWEFQDPEMELLYHLWVPEMAIDLWGKQEVSGGLHNSTDCWIDLIDSMDGILAGSHLVDKTNGY